MKVKELIEALNEQSQDAEVFFLENGNGLYEISEVKSALPHDNEAKEVTGGEFIVLQ